MASKGLGTLTLDLILKMGGFEQGMDKAARLTDKRMRQIETRAVAFGSAIGNVMADAITGAAKSLVNGVQAAADFADQLNDMNQRLGVSAEALSGWAYAAKQSGTDIDALGIGLKKLAKNMAEALDPKSSQGKLFDALGLSVTDAAGKLRDVEDVLPEIAGKFKELDNATQESALAMDLFGKSGTDLLEFLNQGDDGLASLRDRARELGVELDGNTLRAADEFNDTLADIKTISEGLFAQLARELLPTLQLVAEEMRNIAHEGAEGGGAVKFVGDQARAAVGDFQYLNESFKDLVVWLKAVYDGSILAAKGIGTLLFLDISRGIEQLKAASGKADLAYNTFFNGRPDFSNVKGSPVQSVFAGIDPDPAGLFKQTAEQAAVARKEADKLAGSLARVYGGGGGGKANGGSKPKSVNDNADDARKALDDQVKAVVRAREEFDSMAASLSGPLAEAAYRFSVEQQRLNDLAKEGEIDSSRLAEAQANLRKEYDENVEAINRQLDPLGELLKDMEFENSLLGMTNAEREVAIATRGMDADAIAKQAGALNQLRDAYASREQMQEQIGLMDSFRDSVGGLFTDIYEGKNAWDSVKDAFDSFADAVFQFAQSKVLEQLFGQQGTSQSGSSGGWISSLIGAFTGGGGGYSSSASGVSGQEFADIFAGFMGGYASGGTMPANSWARVNENGMEMASVRGRDYLLTGGSPVEITPNHKLGGGGVSVTQVFNNPRLYDRRSDTQRQSEAALKLQRGVKFA